jgi:hypothetical protein
MGITILCGINRSGARISRPTKLSVEMREKSIVGELLNLPSLIHVSNFRTDETFRIPLKRAVC